MTPPPRGGRWGIGVAMVGLTLLPWLHEDPWWPRVLIQELDNCPELACDFLRHYLPQAEAAAAGEEPVSGWVYPPLLALLLRPMVGVIDGASVIAWTLFNLGAMLAMATLAARPLRAWGRGLSRVMGLALVLSSLPMLHGVKFGQVSPWVCVGLVYALSADRRTAVRATVLGLLSAIKVYPAFGAGLWLMRGRWRAAVGAGLAAGVAGVALPVLVDGGAATCAQWSRVFAFQRPGYGAMMGGQTLTGTLTRWFVDGSHTGLPTAAMSPWVFPLEGGVAIAAESVIIPIFSVALAVVALRRARTTDLSVSAALWLVAMGLLLRPGWHHYFAFLPWVHALLLARTGLRGRPGLFTAAAIGLGTVPLLVLGHVEGAYFVYSAWGGTTLVALFTWAALLSLEAHPAVVTDALETEGLG